MRLFTTRESELLRTIIDHLCSGQDRWFEEKGIAVASKSPYWVLNYNSYSEKNDHNELCRGLVIRQPQYKPKAPSEIFDLVESFPFTRFYNHGENRAAAVNLSHADMLEKLDGTMVGVFFPKQGPHAKREDSPHWHTRRMICTHRPDMQMKITGIQGHKFRLLKLIGEYIQTFLKFHRLDLNYTFIFEFIHETTFVITHYDHEKWGLYLIGARNTNDFRECTEDQLDKIAKRIGAKRPRRWDSIDDCDAIDDMMKQAAEQTPNFEGFVFRDRRSYERIKIKDPEYVQKSHLIDSLSYKKLSKLTMQGEADEILSYFPMAEERVSAIIKGFESYVEKTKEQVMKWRGRYRKGICKREDIAGHLLKEGKRPKKDSPESFVCSMILLGLEKESEEEVTSMIKDNLRNVCLGKGKNQGNPRKFLQMINIEDDDKGREID